MTPEADAERPARVTAETTRPPALSAHLTSAVSFPGHKPVGGGATLP